MCERTSHLARFSGAELQQDEQQRLPQSHCRAVPAAQQAAPPLAALSSAPSLGPLCCLPDRLLPLPLPPALAAVWGEWRRARAAAALNMAWQTSRATPWKR